MQCRDTVSEVYCVLGQNANLFSHLQGRESVHGAGLQNSLHTCYPTFLICTMLVARNPVPKFLTLMALLQFLITLTFNHLRTVRTIFGATRWLRVFHLRFLYFLQAANLFRVTALNPVQFTSLAISGATAVSSCSFATSGLCARIGSSQSSTSVLGPSCQIIS